MKQTCQQCNFQFHLTSQRFYCCDQNYVVCSTCRRKPCIKCKKPRTNQIVIPKCNKCYSRLYENDLLLQYNCGRYYCSKCLSQIFREAYIKVSVQKRYEGKSLELAVRLHCGHQFLYEQLCQFFQHFCLSCGREYDSTLDYELNDGVKLCFLCFRYYSQTFAQLFIKCEFCTTVIKNSSNASILENSQMAICQKCTMESKISQNLISQSRKVEQKQTFDQVSSKVQKKPVKIQQKQLYKQASNKPSFSPVEQQKSPEFPKSPLTKLFKKPSISQLKQKQQKRANNNKSNSVSITSRFSNNFEEVDHQITESLGLPDNFKLKKHLSNQTYVQNFAIDVQQNKAKDFVKCKKCYVLVEEKVAYNLYGLTQAMNNTKTSTISLTLSGTLSSISKESEYFICRVCYFRSSQRQKSILNTTTSIKTKSSMSNRPSKLQDTTSSMDYLKPGKSSRKQMRSPSPSPNKQYSLTGSKQSSNLKQSKLDFLQQQSSSKNIQSSSKHSFPVSRQATSNTSQSIPQRFMKCDLCRNMKKSLVATINQGYLCDDCYYKKNPHFESYWKK